MAKYWLEGRDWYFCTICKKYNIASKNTAYLRCNHHRLDVCLSKLTPGLSKSDFEYYRVKGWITGAEEAWKKKEHDIPCECGSVHILNFNFQV